MQLVANAINISLASIYRSVKTGLILKSFVATKVVKFEIIMLFLLKNFVLESENRHQHIEFDKT